MTDILKNYTLYPEITVKLGCQAKLVRKNKYNSAHSEMGAHRELQAVHDMRFFDQTIEEYRCSEKHLNRRFDSFKGFKYRYANDLINHNIAVRDELFKRTDGYDQDAGIETEFSTAKFAESIGKLVHTLRKKTPQQMPGVGPADVVIQSNNFAQSSVLKPYKDPTLKHTTSVPRLFRVVQRPVTSLSTNLRKSQKLSSAVTQTTVDPHQYSMGLSRVSSGLTRAKSKMSKANFFDAPPSNRVENILEQELYSFDNK